MCMKKVLSAEQMREVDRLTTERYGIPSILLMENAAHAVVEAIEKKLNGSVKGKHVLIICGKGNNGGDGAAVARIMAQRGGRVTVVLLGKTADTNGDAAVNFLALEKIANSSSESGNGSGRIDFYDADQDPKLVIDEFVAKPDAKIIVDAIFGTGLTREASGIYAEVIRRLEEHSGLVLAVDIPSGIDAGKGQTIGPSVKASSTVTFTAPKPGNVLAPASRYNGELAVANIGSPHELIDEQPSQLFLTEPADVCNWLKLSEFTSSSYKNKRGHALIIAGSRNYTGAAVLCGDAAIRSGVGLTTLAVPEGSRESVVARVSPEVMVRGISETPDGSAAEKAFDDVAEFTKNVDVIAVGSGLSSKEDETRRFIRKLVTERTMPVVIDADGLTALSPFDIKGSSDLPLILTPHEGEFMKLLGTDDKSVIDDRVQAVREFAVTHQVTLVLKGERVLIGEPGGKVVVNPTGNPGLGKAGNGDTLTGIITGFAAQAVQMKIDMFHTVVAAVYIASFAGDVAEEKYGKRVMTASDVRECLVKTFAQFSAND